MTIYNFRTRTPKGDGNVAPSRLLRRSFVFISEHELRKGTETLLHLFQRAIRRNFRTRTPKGDGNERRIGGIKMTMKISEHEPRKGTETFDQSLHHRQFLSFQNTNPERGRKLLRGLVFHNPVCHFRTRTLS